MENSGTVRTRLNGDGIPNPPGRPGGTHKGAEHGRSFYGPDLELATHFPVAYVVDQIIADVPRFPPASNQDNLFRHTVPRQGEVMKFAALIMAPRAPTHPEELAEPYHSRLVYLARFLSVKHKLTY